MQNSKEEIACGLAGEERETCGNNAAWLRNKDCFVTAMNLARTHPKISTEYYLLHIFIKSAIS
jgi:hypothetical protein